MPHEDARKAIDRLQEAGLIFRRKQSAIEMYMFKHALVQDTAYASMLRSERQPLHARIAKTLATKFIDVAEGAPEIIAYHYTQAREVRPAIHIGSRLARSEQAIGLYGSDYPFQSALKLLEELPEDKGAVRTGDTDSTIVLQRIDGSQGFWRGRDQCLH